MTNITKQHKELASRLGELLAKSNLDDETKNLIVENADQLPEHAVYKLIRVLDGEQKQIDMAAFDISLFVKEQDKNWSKVLEEQNQSVSAIANKWLVKMSN